MSYFAYSLAIPAILLMGAGYLHIRNINCVHEKIEYLMGGKGSVSKEDLYREMTVAQGMNFIGLTNVAWVMLFVSIAFLYFLIPTDLPFSYIKQLPELASHPLGFFFFGIITTFFAFILIMISDILSESRRNWKFTELYSFYDICKNIKVKIISTIPLLSLSIVLSAWNAILYPEQYMILGTLSFILIIISIVILVWPIWMGRK